MTPRGKPKNRTNCAGAGIAVDSSSEVLKKGMGGRVGAARCQPGVRQQRARHSQARVRPQLPRIGIESRIVNRNSICPHPHGLRLQLNSAQVFRGATVRDLSTCKEFKVLPLNLEPLAGSLLPGSGRWLPRGHPHPEGLISMHNFQLPAFTVIVGTGDAYEPTTQIKTPCGRGRGLRAESARCGRESDRG
jgi:hypothetical protein